MKNRSTVVFSIVRSLLTFTGGVFAVLGEIDDSPGLILIGLIFLVVSIYFNIKKK